MRRNIFDYSLFYEANSCKVEGCDDSYYGAGYCKKHHQWYWTRGLIEKPTLPSPKEAILRGSCPIPESGCWIWLGPINNHGYGRVNYNGESEFVHRLSYRTFIDEIPSGLIVCHKCDVPSCVSPNHLWLGTFKDNSIDSVLKGRNSNGTPKTGIDHKRSVLSFNDIERILTTRTFATDIAKEIGIHPATIRRVQNGESYKEETKMVSGNLYAE